VLLTKQFRPEQVAQALDSWHWVGGLEGKQPLFASLFGAVILGDGSGYWWLDPISGTFEHIARDRTSLIATVDSAAGQDSLLLGGLAMAADRQGMHLGPDEIYVFVPPPALGGSFELENIRPGDFVVEVHIAGQLHQQIKDLPPGTKITGVTIQADAG
jgi:hypothetical protein